MKKQKYCFDCGKTINKKAIRCHSCAARKKNLSLETLKKRSIAARRGYVLIENKCIECGKIIHKRSTRCHACENCKKALSPEFREKIAARKRGIKRPETTRKKISKALQGKKRLDLTGEKHPNWKGGKFLNKGSYVMIYMPNHPYRNKSYILEHRLVMEEKAGRFLKPHEIVHHLDGNTQNNSPENLELFSSQGDHLSYHERMEYYINHM